MTTANTTPRHNAYKKGAKNVAAVTKLITWLKSVNISCELSNDSSYDVLVKRIGAPGLPVRVAMDSETSGSAFVVMAKDLTNRKTKVAMAAFHSVTSAAGYGTPDPMALRGEEPPTKLHFKDNFELVAMRHKEFRRVPNPSTEDLTALDPIINRAVNRAMYVNAWALQRNGLTADDLKTYARLWTCNFLGLYKSPDPTYQDDGRKLYAHLCQRFLNFAEVLARKERSVVPDIDAFSIAMTGSPYANPSKDLGATIHDFEQTSQDTLEFSQEEDASLSFLDDPLSFVEDLESPEVVEAPEAKPVSEKKRRKAAQDALKSALESLGHDGMILALRSAMSNTFICVDARVEARKQLRLHKEACPLCAEV